MVKINNVLALLKYRNNVIMIIVYYDLLILSMARGDIYKITAAENINKQE